MSFVSVVAMNNFISVVADGRESKTKNNKLEIINENFEKIKRLNNYQFITCTGDAKVATEIFGLFSEIKFYDLKRCANDLKRELKKIDYNIVKSQCIIGGKNQLNQFVLYRVSNKPEESVIEYLPQNSDLDFVSMSSEQLKGKFDPSAKFAQMYRAKKITSFDDVIRIQEDLNNMVADVDNTVNKNTKKLLLE